MDTKHWTSITTILDEALELAPDERVPFINNYKGLSDEIRQEAISFLKSIHKSDHFWDELIESNNELVEQIDKDTFNSQPIEDSSPPSQIGPYKILSKIASGGMGNVYLAERTDGHLQITVALKLIRRECIDNNHIHQFNTERNILGRLNHPHIARIYDGGITENGRPYLVLEYVDGVPVTDFCRSNNCTIDKKLKLFGQICEGVNFAHSNLVVHRDLKPDNIFLKPNGSCKILDFGIAKMIDPDGQSSDADKDAPKLRPFSICHAAPEQLSDGTITTATDVYALGLLLYELLTGTLPYDLKGKSPSHAFHIIDSTPLPAASSKAENKTDANKLRGDLDEILQHALHKDPSRRYQSAGDLLSDISNYRKHLPLSFKQDQRLYKLTKFASRNSGLLSGITVLLIILTSLSFYYISTIKFERQKAIAEEQKASYIAGFMVDLFDASDPLNNITDTLSVYDILQTGRDKLDSWEGSQLSKADIMISLGNAYKKLGDYDQSRTLLEDAYRIYEIDTPDSLATQMLRPTVEIANLHKEERNFSYAAHYFDRSLQIIDKQDETRPEMASIIYSGYGATLTEIGNPQLAIIYLEKALQTIRSANLSDSYTRTTQTNLAQAYRRNEEYQRSEALYKELLDILPADDFNTSDVSIIHNNLGYLLKVQDKFDEAIIHYNRSLEINRFIYGLKHPNTKIVMNNLAALHATNGQYELAEDIRLDLLEISREDFGELHWRTGSAYESLGILKIHSGNMERAAEFFEKATEIYTDTLGGDHIWTERTMLYYSLSRFNSNESQVAKSQFHEAFESLKEKRIYFSRYDVEVMNHLINNFKPYPSISTSPDFARLEEIK